MQILPSFISNYFSEPKHPTNEKEVLSLFITAKLKEIQTLATEQKSLERMYEPYKVTHPTLFSKRIDELIDYYIHSEKSVLLQSEHSISLESFKQMDESEKVDNFFFYPISGQSIFSMILQDFVPENLLIMHPIENASPFYHSDLIVVDESYKGPLPLNAIYKSNFEKTVEFYKEIVEGKTSLQIEGSIHFKMMALSSIQKLLTREVTRTFLDKVLRPKAPNFFMRFFTSVPYDYTIKLSSSRIKSDERPLSQKTYQIQLSDEKYMTGLHSLENGEFLTSKLPKYIELSYRLLCLHHSIQKTPLESQNNFYDDPYEKIALTGCQGKADNNEITENKISEVFSLLPRIL